MKVTLGIHCLGNECVRWNYDLVSKVQVRFRFHSRNYEIPSDSPVCTQVEDGCLRDCKTGTNHLTLFWIKEKVFWFCDTLKGERER